MKTLTGGNFKAPDGTPLASGSISFDLCVDAVTIAGGQVAPMTVVYGLDSSGNIQAGATIFGNDELLPANTYYIVNAYASTGARVFGAELWFITGTSPIDIGTIVPTQSSISFPAPVLLNPGATQTITNYPLFLKNLNSIRFADQFAGASVGAKIDTACADLSGAQGLVVIPASMGAGWSLIGIPSNATVWDLRGNGGSSQVSFARGIDYYTRITSTNGGFSIPSTILLEQDAFGGGVNALPTKTQWQPLRIEMQGRTIGERKGIEANVYTYGKGDSIGGMFSSYDWGGFSTGGDEGSEGLRATSQQGFGNNTVPVGTVASVSGNTVTGSWTAGSNFALGEQRPLINTSRGVYSTGTLASGGGTAPFTIVGSGTTWAATFGAGAKSDLFLEYTALNGAARFVVPVLSIVDDTHLTAEYNIAEIGASGFNPSGAYKIFKGGLVSSLAAPPSGNTNANAVNLAAGGSGFQVGDSIEQPLGYNYHGIGVKVVLQAALATGGGAGSSGVGVSNIGAYEYHSAYRSDGPFTDGLSFDSVLSRAGVLFTHPVGSMLMSFNTASTGESIAYVLDNGGVHARQILYDRTSPGLDFWTLGGLRLAGSGLNYAFNTNPVPGTHIYEFYNDATMDGFGVNPAATPNAGVRPFYVAVAGQDRFAIENTKMVVNKGVDVFGYSDNRTTQKWGITGSSGAGRFDGGVQVGSGTNITKMVVYTPSFGPVSVAAQSTLDQPFAVTGLTTADKVIVNGPAPTPGTGIVNVRVSAADQLMITFINTTAGALTPANGTYSIIAIRS
jgi:hypothetical protein